MKAVIGAAYGDEGKGSVTNSLSSFETLVVRFNGGAQAGHTVETHLRRHVFRHFGSGTLKGARTYLSRHFIFNPILFLEEYHELLPKLKHKLHVWADPQCMVTTPYDMIMNQILEKSRGKRHGSCGVGINETVVRCERGYSLPLSEPSPDLLRLIVKDYVPQRLEEFGLKKADFPQFSDQFIFDRFLVEHEYSLSKMSILSWESLERGPDWLDLVFEGAQGLQLDQNNKQFPHVTRSNTGLDNVLDLIPNEDLEVYYVTRCYLTRHGNGPMPHEYGKPYAGIEEKTNSFNKNQGEFRFSVLDFDLLKDGIKEDLNKKSSGTIKANLVMTCCDQLDTGVVKFVRDGKLGELPLGELLSLLKSELGLHDVFYSKSPIGGLCHDFP